jgi:BASS family bile acid:Na+ symporter
MRKIKDIIKDWMLPIAIISGISVYLIYYFTPALRPLGPVCGKIVSEGQRLLIAIMLFLQFVKVSPHDLKFKRWHLYAAIFQVVTAGAIGAVIISTPPGDIRILLECAMICLICPTAAAAGVITDRLEGSLAETISYVVIINAIATLFIPTLITGINPTSGIGFWRYVLGIFLKIFPMLIAPCLLAWIIRYSTHKLQRWLMRYSHWSFYFWFFGLTFAMILSTKALVHSHIGIGTILCIMLISMGSCAIQFYIGGHFSKNRKTRITARQALGQKNTVFMIWMGASFLNPVTAISGGFYSIWHNTVNSYQLYKNRKQR